MMRHIVSFTVSLVIYLVGFLPASASWICGSDFCTEGEEFCRVDPRTNESTCRRCEDYKISCFTYAHEANCSAWCKADFIKTLEADLKKTLEGKDCDGLPPVVNGRYNSTVASLHKGEKLAVTCNERYSLRGSDHITCKAYGQLSDLPTCEAITCLVPPEPENGTSDTPVGSVLQIDQSVQYTCLDGFEPVGPEVVTCTASGQTDKRPPVCIKKKQDCSDYAELQHSVEEYKRDAIVFGILAAVFSISLGVVFIVWCIKKIKQTSKSNGKKKRGSPSVSSNSLSDEEESQKLLKDLGSNPADKKDSMISSSFAEENEETHVKIAGKKSTVSTVPDDEISNSSSDEHEEAYSRGITAPNHRTHNNNNNTNHQIDGNNISGAPGHPVTGSNDSIGSRNNHLGRGTSTNGNTSSVSITNNHNPGKDTSQTNNNNVNTNQINIHLPWPYPYNPKSERDDQVLYQPPPSTRGPPPPPSTRGPPPPSTVGIQEEGDVNNGNMEIKTPSAPVEPLQPRHRERAHPEQDDSGEKAIGSSVNGDMPTAARVISKQLSDDIHLHTEEESAGTEKVAVGTGEADQQDFGEGGRRPRP